MNLGYCKLDTMRGKYNLLETLFRLSVVSFNVHFTLKKKQCNISNITPCISLQQKKYQLDALYKIYSVGLDIYVSWMPQAFFLQAVKDHMHNLTPENTMNQRNLLLVRRMLMLGWLQYNGKSWMWPQIILLFRADSTWLSPVHLRFPKQSLPCLRVSNQRRQLPT